MTLLWPLVLFICTGSWKSSDSTRILTQHLMENISYIYNIFQILLSDMHPIVLIQCNTYLIYDGMVYVYWVAILCTLGLRKNRTAKLQLTCWPRSKPNLRRDLVILYIVSYLLVYISKDLCILTISYFILYCICIGAVYRYYESRRRLQFLIPSQWGQRKQ